MFDHPCYRRFPALAPTMAALLALAACGAGGGESAGSGTDTIPPQAGQVFDGPDTDIDTQESRDTITANWVDFLDDLGPVTSYEWAIGTTPGGQEVQTWTDVGAASSASNDTLQLQVSATYFCAVRAYDAAGNVSAVATSDGVTIESSGSGGGSTTALASSISHQGVTWQFSRPERVGRFANGDWWVQGPVEIVSIYPPSQEVSGRVIHGSMLNPDATAIDQGLHGYDSTLYGPYAGSRYQPSRNVAWGVSPSSPLLLGAGNSLISSISWTDSDPPANGSFSQLQTAVVLTVLADEAPPGSFRPPYSGNDKTIRHNEADLDYSSLGTVLPAAQQPDFADTATRFERVWLDHCSSWTSRYLHPIDNMPDYGRDFTSLYGTGALMLQLDLPNSQKRDLLVRMTQIGIDFWGNVQNGGSWSGVGGQCSGRKFPILFAGRVLNDGPMLSLGTSHPSGYFGPGNPSNASQFGEDCQTFYVEQTAPGIYNWGHGGYDGSHNGMPEWGNSHTQYPSNDNVLWEGDPYRRCCTANAWVGQTLAAHIMNLEGAWAHPAYFDYMDRYMQIENVGEWTRNWEPWQGNMWDLHRASF